MSAIRGAPSKTRRGVHWYIEECFAKDNEEVCHLRRFYLLRLKQSRHFRLLVSRGVKGSDVIAPPQPAHCQEPENFGLSPEFEDGATAGPNPSSKSGSPARPASKGKSGASGADDISGAGAELPSFCLL